MKAVFSCSRIRVMRYWVVLLQIALWPVFSSGQKQLDHEDFGIWNTIRGEQLSADGRYVAYVLEAELKDPVLVVYDAERDVERRFDRAGRHAFSAGSDYVAFAVQAGRDALRPFKRKGVKKEEWPGDTLVVLSLEGGELRRFPGLKAFTLPDKWSEWLVFEQRVMPAEDTVGMASDSVGEKKGDYAGVKAKGKSKDSDKTQLVVMHLASGSLDTLGLADDWSLSPGSPLVARHIEKGGDSLQSPGLYIRNLSAGEERCVDTGAFEMHQWVWHDSLPALAWLRNRDAESDNHRAAVLMLSAAAADARLIADSSWAGLPGDWCLSEHRQPEFSRDGKRLYFGTAPMPVKRDTNILDEEWPVLEVWHSGDQVLYTQQVNRLKRERERSYLAVAHLDGGSLVQLGRPEVPELLLAADGDADFALGMDDRAYQKFVSWEGHDYTDLYLIDQRDGSMRLLDTMVYGRPSWSPEGKYLSWYAPLDSAWVLLDPFRGTRRSWGHSSGYPFTEEAADMPRAAGSYGSPGWIAGDSGLLLYDRYDLWLVDPTGAREPERLTRGREGRERFRIIRRDEEQRYWPVKEPWLVHRFSETTKAEGYGLLRPGAWSYEWITDGPYRYARSVQQAKESPGLLFTRENFHEFPDLWLADFPELEKGRKISDANPQQGEYAWGDISLHKWEGPDGTEVEGLLVTPANFSADSSYPLIVNFYEKSADGLHQHRHPYAHRSTINYSFYASRGYVIFNPDIHYAEGDPGESAMRHVMSGLDYLLGKGFVDSARMALQGHSWGGYQIAHIITGTNRFACAASGAPVVNMVSAYGGIRWGTGMSRMFQYERTQSRLGRTLWEDPDRYLRNSPIFHIPDIETPVLILHNDEDGAVPWYQGIEFFVALRRLNKPAWLLNYNGEPHWPLKLANRLDFHKRLQQFFDHYLQGAEAPEWMETGVPAVKRDYELGY